MQINTIVRPRFKSVYVVFNSPQKAQRFYLAAKECLKSLDVENREPYVVTMVSVGLEDHNRALFFATGYEAALCSKEN